MPSFPLRAFMDLFEYLHMFYLISHQKPHLKSVSIHISYPNFRDSISLKKTVQSKEAKNIAVTAI